MIERLPEQRSWNSLERLTDDSARRFREASADKLVLRENSIRGGGKHVYVQTTPQCVLGPRREFPSRRHGRLSGRDVRDEHENENRTHAATRRTEEQTAGQADHANAKTGRSIRGFEDAPPFTLSPQAPREIRIAVLREQSRARKEAVGVQAK